MPYDRQSLAQSLIEGALRASADPSVTAVLRDWDWYGPGDKAQPLCPFLCVGMSDDTPYGIGIGLYRAQAQVMINVVSSPSIRDDFDRIRGSVRSVMASLRGLSAADVLLSGSLETSCTEPVNINESGDVVYCQVLAFTVWFEALPPQPVPVDPEIYLADRDPETGVTYTTTQGTDPRRIERWSRTDGILTLSQGFGTWSDRAALAYTAPVTPPETALPVQPPSTEIPPTLPITPSASVS